MGINTSLQVERENSTQTKNTFKRYDQQEGRKHTKLNQAVQDIKMVYHMMNHNFKKDENLLLELL